MDTFEASQALDRIDQVSSRARRAGHWYAIFLTIFGTLSVLFASSFSLVTGKWGALTLTGLFLLATAALLIWALRQRAALAGMGRLQAMVMGLWGLLWAVTVGVGSTALPGRPLWWISGGVAMAMPCLIGAWVVHRRTTASRPA